MGCDIHLIVQRRNDVNSPWILVDEPFAECDWCLGKGHYENRPADTCYICKGSGKTGTYNGRNYDLFAQLANVRNGSGFAGTDTGDGFIPISDPRGLPEDVEEHFGEPDEYGDQKYWMGDHSHSYLTLHELLNYDISRTTNHRGIVQYSTWRAWGGKTAPLEYCTGVSGPGVEVISSKEAVFRLNTGKAAHDKTYVRVQWCETYQESAAHFWNKFVPALRSLGAPENVRVVFGFDS